MDELEFVTLEDGLNYIITDEIFINNTKYVYLTEEKELSKICIRKVNIIDNEEYLVVLDNEEEFKLALSEFTKKHHN